MDRRDAADLIAAVQHNCDLADARHAGDLSLCTYLVEIGELFRWQRDLPLSATPGRAEVGTWIAAREASWQALADEPGVGYAAVDHAMVVTSRIGSRPCLRIAVTTSSTNSAGPAT